MRVLPYPVKIVDLVKQLSLYIFGKNSPLKLFPLRRGIYTFLKQENIKNIPKPFLHKSP